MTTGPRLRVGSSLLPGVLAIALFAIMALVVVNTPFESMSGYPEGLTITKELGYAMFDLSALQSGEGGIPETESFLLSFLLIAVVLDAALDASLVLAKREEDGQPVSPLSSVTREEGDGLARTATDGGDGTRDATESADEPTSVDGGDEA